MKEKLLYIGMKYDYGNKSRGLSFEHRNFFHPLKSYCKANDRDFIHYDFMERGEKLGIDLMTEELYELVKKEKPGYLFAVLFDFNRDPRHEVFKRISELGVKTIHWFCDDHWRFEKYSSVVAPNFDFICTTANSALPKYKKLGISERVIKTQWACNHELYVPYNVEKDIDISFIGQPHGDRKELIEKIIKAGIDIKIFGFNWEKYPRIPFHQMVRVFSRSKINLNLSNSSTMIGQQIKGRNFEIPGTKSFLLTSNAENLEEYYENGKEIVIFDSVKDLIAKTKYYLSHPAKRESIAQNAFKRTIAEHTWHHRYNEIFSFVNHAVSSKTYAPKAQPVNSKTKETKNSLLISVVIPCYNQAHLLSEAIESVVKQTYEDWECIIVNDGSPDNTTEVAQKLISQYSDFKIRLIEKTNGGLAGARNTGIEAAAGEYILPLDADDTLKHNALETFAAVVKENKEYDIFYSDYETFGTQQKYVTCIAENEFLNPLRSDNGLPYCSLYKKEVWSKNSGYNSNMIWGFEDWDFWLSSLANGFKAKHLALPLLNYRLKNQSMITNALKYNEHLIAQMVLNHCSLYADEVIENTKKIIADNPVVSVLLPTYNRPDLLRKAIQSILEQDSCLFEIIVINDAGKDVSGTVLEFNDPRIKYIEHQENKGLAAARNTGLKAAKGKFIALLDDDDIFYPAHLKTALKHLSGKTTVIYTDAVRFTYDKSKQKVINKTVPYSIDYKRNKLLIGNIAPVNCFVFEKSLIEKIGLFDENLPVLEDWEFWLRLSSISSFKHIKENTVQVNWFDDGTTMTSSKQEAFGKTRNYIYKKYESEIKKIPNRDEIITEFNSIWQKDSKTSIPLVSIIALSYNQVEYTKSFIDSVIQNTDVPFELIIIDNASGKETVKYLTEVSKSDYMIKIIFNKENLGFPKGVNQGIKAASGKYILIANNDIVVTKYWLNRMVELAESNNQVGLVGPISNIVSGVQLDKNAAYKTIDEMHRYAESNAKLNSGKYFQFPRIAFLCTLIKREVINKIGGLDERFSPGNFEDDDFCLRAQIAGYKTLIAQDVFIHHFGSKSFTAEGTKKYQERLDINKKIFIEKWGADPEEIWLHGKPCSNKSVEYPLDIDVNAERIKRAQACIKDQEYSLALSYLENIFNDPANKTDEKFHQSSATLYHLAAKICLMEKNYDKAEKYFRMELEMQPESSRAYEGLGDVYSEMGQDQDAMDMFNKSLKISADNVIVSEKINAIKKKLELINI
ncbi:MAG: glycosyltransferase [Bacteroidetes bacterium]|nr:glycosyltransferase [Bacteroidota bacterium]